MPKAAGLPGRNDMSNVLWITQQMSMVQTVVAQRTRRNATQVLGVTSVKLPRRRKNLRLPITSVEIVSTLYHIIDRSRMWELWYLS